MVAEVAIDWDHLLEAWEHLTEVKEVAVERLIEVTAVEEALLQKEAGELKKEVEGPKMEEGELKMDVVEGLKVFLK